MPLNVLIVPDKFKGTLTASQAAGAIAQGWRRARPDDRLDLLPMSDGGDGFGEILGLLLDGEPTATETVDAAQRLTQSRWWWSASTRTAIVESARVIGLAMLPPGQFHPFALDTRGLGTVLRAAVERGARHCLMGIGGSATNDAGFGLALALGWQFLDEARSPITRWVDLDALSTVVPPAQPIGFETLTVAVDVRNQLLGPAGCSRIYGPQKGLVEFERAERALGRLAEVMASHNGSDHSMLPGAGAAGGLGFGLVSFAGGRLQSGIEVFKHHAGLENRVRAADLVITGEGAIDAQTLMGKGVGEIAALCQRLEVPCVGLAGVVEDLEQARGRFWLTSALTPDFTDRESALREPARWLQRVASEAALRWSLEAEEPQTP
jgi:glycerate kinase